MTRMEATSIASTTRAGRTRESFVHQFCEHEVSFDSAGGLPDIPVLADHVGIFAANDVWLDASGSCSKVRLSASNLATETCVWANVDLEALEHAANKSSTTAGMIGFHKNG